jgi:hypothetical protein
VARIATPWFRSERNAWFVCKVGQQHFLGEHPADAPPPRKHKGKWNAPQPIVQAFHRLMAAPPAKSPKQPPAAGLSLAGLFEKFLDWSQRNQAAATYEWYRVRIQSFIDHLDQPRLLLAQALKPYHVQEWIDAHTDWGSTFRHGAIRSVQRAFNWAVELGYLDQSPVRGIKKPPSKRREQALTPAEWERIRDHYAPGDPFRDLLEFCWETCEPTAHRGA